MPRYRYALYILLFIVTGCGEYPKDPHHTLSTIQQKNLLIIGIVHHPPWTDIRTFPPAGTEVELAQQFADTLGVAPQWEIVDMENGITLLEEGKLNLLIGGILESTPYKNAGFTRLYRITTSNTGEKHKHIMAVRRGENRFLVTLERFLKHAVTQPKGI